MIHLPTKIASPHALLVALCVAGYWAAPAQSVFEPGKSYFRRSNYVEYIAGDMPLIVSAPHGGRLKPSEIPDRARGEFTSDAHTEELARAVQQAFYQLFGHYPHIIICRLERRKVDCNRDLDDGAGDDPGARAAWNDYHQFIDVARSNVLARSHTGFYVDLHGQSHAIKRIELGYCLDDDQLALSDQELNEARYVDRSTIRALMRRTGVPFAELLRGTNSFGALLVAKGYPAVPSPAMPDPGAGNSYFDGGYDVRQHTSAKGGAIDGVQMELNYAGVRDTAANRAQFARAFAEVCYSYFTHFYGLDLRTLAGIPGKHRNGTRESE